MTVLKLESLSLIVLPLTAEQLQLFMADPHQYASSLGYPGYTPEPANADLSDALCKMAKSIAESPQHWPWNSNWAIISKLDNAVVGGIDFHGPPNSEGQAEVGYGLDSAFRGNGLMSQALSLMAAWAFTHPEVRTLLAETEMGNLASQRVLQRGGFCPYTVKGSNIWWRLPRPDGI